jgi:hypothetical protein
MLFGDLRVADFRAVRLRMLSAIMVWTSSIHLFANTLKRSFADRNSAPPHLQVGSVQQVQQFAAGRFELGLAANWRRVTAGAFGHQRATLNQTFSSNRPASLLAVAATQTSPTVPPLLRSERRPTFWLHDSWLVSERLRDFPPR